MKCLNRRFLNIYLYIIGLSYFCNGFVNSFELSNFKSIILNIVSTFQNIMKTILILKAYYRFHGFRVHSTISIYLLTSFA